MKNGLGWLQNLKSISLEVTYVTGSMQALPNSGTPDAPWLDTGRPNAGTGGATAFVRTSTPNLVAGANTGVIYEVLSRDSVAWSFSATHPVYGTNWSTSRAGWSFVNYLTAFSSDFPHNYTVIGFVDWLVVGNGKSGCLGIWKDNGSYVSFSNFKTPVVPIAGEKLGLQPVGPGTLTTTEDFM
jgi:hypothetical protein